MSHDTEPRDRRDLIADIADAADALTDPHPHVEPISTDEPNAAGKRKTIHRRTTVPGLIAQLRAAAEPGADGEAGGAGGPESCPVAIDAVSLLASIEFGAAIRCRQAGVTLRQTAEDNIRALVGAAPRLPRSRSRTDPRRCAACEQRDRPTGPTKPVVVHWDLCPTCHPVTQAELAAELRSWQRQAAIITQWQAAPIELLAPCMYCEARGSLLAHPDGSAAWCKACDTRWDDPTEMANLGRHVSQYRATTEAATREARTRAVEERRRRDGQPADLGHAGRGRTAA